MVIFNSYVKLPMATRDMAGQSPQPEVTQKSSVGCACGHQGIACKIGYMVYPLDSSSIDRIGYFQLPRNSIDHVDVEKRLKMLGRWFPTCMLVYPTPG